MALRGSYNHFNKLHIGDNVYCLVRPLPVSFPPLLIFTKEASSRTDPKMRMGDARALESWSRGILPRRRSARPTVDVPGGFFHDLHFIILTS